MNRLTLTGIAAILVALVTYAVYYRALTAPDKALVSKPQGGLEWLRREFQLSEAQFARITALHEAYGPVCGELCERIGEANSRLEKLTAANRGMCPELEAALADCAAVRRDCNAALLRHAYAVAAEMPPESGQRYLRMMTARLTQPAPWYSRGLSRKPD